MTRDSTFLTLAGFCFFFEKTTCRGWFDRSLETVGDFALPHRSAPPISHRPLHRLDSRPGPGVGRLLPDYQHFRSTVGLAVVPAITSRRKANSVSDGICACMAASGARWPPRRPRAGSRTYFRSLHSQRPTGSTPRGRAPHGSWAEGPPCGARSAASRPLTVRISPDWRFRMEGGMQPSACWVTRFLGTTDLSKYATPASVFIRTRRGTVG